MTCRNRTQSYVLCQLIISMMLLFGMQLSTASAEIKIVFPEDNTITPDTRPADNPLLTHTGDFSIPLPVRFSWMVTGEPFTAGYSFYLSSDSLIDSSDLYRTGVVDTFCDVWNLELNRRYYWKVSGAGEAETSGRYTFTTASEWPRMIYVDGTTNVRDIGGCLVDTATMIRQGLLYRSAEFNQTKKITEKGLEQLRVLGIVTEIDLKMELENPQNVIPWLPRYVRPLSDSGDGMALYLDGLTKTPEVVAAVFKEMANPLNYPMIIHCRMGADRSGEIFAMVEAILGCSDEHIMLDYIWSSLSTFGRRDTISINWRDFIAYLRSFDPEGGTLQKGSRNYLMSIGVTAEELESLRSIFLQSGEMSIGRQFRGVPKFSGILMHRSRVVLSLQQQFFHNTSGAGGTVFDLSGRVRCKESGYAATGVPGLYIVSSDRHGFQRQQQKRHVNK